MITNGTKHVDRMSEMTPPASSAVLVFPDDFNSNRVLASLARLRLLRPKVLPVLITKDPHQFELLPLAEGGVVPLVIPKPIWGWAILDAVRSRLGSGSHEAKRS